MDILDTKKRYSTETKAVLIGLSLAFILFLSLFIYFYITASKTGLPGRKGGPQDAFRHVYASAVVSKYTSPKIVEVITALTEGRNGSVHDVMDRHNNKIGMLIGQNSDNLYQTVLVNVKRGTADAKGTGQVTWLSKDQWTKGF